MSSGIMERNLPVATELGEGDMVRIVTSAGNSKQIDADAFGGGLLACNFHVEGDGGYIDKSYNDIISAIQAGVIPVLVDNTALPIVSANLFSSYYYDSGDTHPYNVYFADNMQFVADNATDNLAIPR